MNKKELSICLLLFFIACNSNKKQATAFLENARRLYEQGEYSTAKNNLDSIKKLFPKEFGIQKQGLQLKRQIDTKVQERNLSFCDSMMQIRMAQADTMKSGFLFEKDKTYDEVGKYIDKSQRIETRLQSSYIRTYVNELGEILFSSVYYGNRPIHHSQLKVSKSNGEYAETQVISYDGGLNYSFVDGGMTTEVVTYTQGKDNGVIQFIYNNKEFPLKAEYLDSEKVKYTFTISTVDKNALAKIFDFAIVLSDINKLKKEKEKSAQRLQYLGNKVTSQPDEDVK
jgi:hypothetical protein